MGLEALHRSLYPTKPTPRLVQKVERILAQIQLDKDRDWAAPNLGGSTEPPLHGRLFKLLSMRPTPLDSKQLAFTQRCAARRNDVSHFDGERAPGEYEAFLKEIVHLGRALDILYHALLLHARAQARKVNPAGRIGVAEPCRRGDRLPRHLGNP